MEKNRLNQGIDIKKLIEYSVIVPVYNSADTLNELYLRISAVFKEITENYELVLVDDCSKDGSWNKMQKLKQKDGRIKIIQLMRNFGQHNAVMCGFNFAQGKYIVTLDDDLQNPPEEIPKLISKIKEGYDVVYGAYKQKRHSLLRNIGSRAIWFAYKRIFRTNVNITAFRMIHSSIVEAIKEYDMNYTFIDGLVAWNTNRIGQVVLEHTERKKGRSGYTLGKLMVLSLSMLTNFWIFPLQMASLLGILFSLLGFCGSVSVIIIKYVIKIPVAGFTAIFVAVTFFAGVQLLSLGMIGEYIGRMHLNINKRPQYRIRKTIL